MKLIPTSVQLRDTDFNLRFKIEIKIHSMENRNTMFNIVFFKSMFFARYFQFCYLFLFLKMVKFKYYQITVISMDTYCFKYITAALHHPHKY